MPRVGVTGRKKKDYKLKCDKVVEMMNTGLSMQDAGYIAGVSHDSIQRWRETDPEFNEACFQAKAEFKRIHLERVAEAGKKWWAASAWLLERNFPEEFGQRSTVALQGNVTEEMVKRLNAGRERARESVVISHQKEVVM